MRLQLLTKRSGLMHIGFISDLLGLLLNAMFMLLFTLLGIQNIALAIILFTVVVYLILTPLTYQQQKFALFQTKMNPEVQAIQARYKGKTDQASMMAMREEQKFVYSKYGVSTAGSCLTPLISLLILFNLIFVVYSIPAYIHPVGDLLNPLAEALKNNTDAIAYLKEATKHLGGYAKPNFTDNFAALADADKIKIIVDALYQLSQNSWNEFQSKFHDIAITINGESIANGIAYTSAAISKMTDFFGMNISDTPMTLVKQGNYFAAIIPILSALLQFINIKLMPNINGGNNDNNMMARNMKTMNYIMPIFSLIFTFQFPIGIGIYWTAGPVVRSIQQILINHHIKKINVDDVIENNLYKYNLKRSKEGLPPITDVSGLSKGRKLNVVPKATEEQIKRVDTAKSRTSNIDSSSLYEKEAKSGSLFDKARMVEKLNNKNKD